MEEFPFLASSLSGEGVRLKQQFTEKSTDPGICLNCFSFAPKAWKQGTLKHLVYRVYNICFIEYILRKEFLNLEKCFICKNSCPPWVIKQMLTQVEKQ